MNFPTVYNRLFHRFENNNAVLIIGICKVSIDSQWSRPLLVNTYVLRSTKCENSRVFVSFRLRFSVEAILTNLVSKIGCFDNLEGYTFQKMKNQSV